MSDPGRELDQPQPPDHAGVQAVYQKLALLTKHNLKIPSFHKYNTPFSDGDLQPAKIVDHYLTGKELYKEIKKYYGLSGADLVRQIYSEHLLEGNQSNAAVSRPSQRMIDNILARRSIQRLEKKKQTAKMFKKLNEEKVCLEKMLQELQLEKKSFRHDFKVSPQDMENKSTLQNRIHSTMERLPELEARVQNLREELYREDEKKLRPYIGESLSVAAEPYQLQDMKMVQELLGEMVEDLMDDYIIHVPQDIKPECEKDKRVKILEEMSFERAVQLIMEQLVLEVTFEMAKQLGQETFTDKSPTWTLGFDIIFRATEERNVETHTGGTMLRMQMCRELAILVMGWHNFNMFIYNGPILLPLKSESHSCSFVIEISGSRTGPGAVGIIKAAFPNSYCMMVSDIPQFFNREPLFRPHRQEMSLAETLEEIMFVKRVRQWSEQ